MAKTLFTHPTFLSVLDVLGLAVLADRHERDREMLEFVNGAQTMAREIDVERIVSRADLRDWFAANRERLLTTRAEDALAAVTDPDLHCPLLAAVFAITVCDYVLADEEAAFIRTALEVWGPSAEAFAKDLERLD